MGDSLANRDLIRELGAAAYEAAAADGSVAEKYAVRGTVPHLADTELRRELE